MPFTPFHIGPALLTFGIFTFLDPLALLYGSILVDLEPLLVVLFGLPSPLHGPMHSVVGVLLLLPIFYVATVISRRIFPKIDFMFTLKVKRYPSSLSIASSGVGGYSHILLDSFLYWDLNLAWPFLDWNPLLHQLSALSVYGISTLSFIIGLVLILWQRKERLL